MYGIKIMLFSFNSPCRKENAKLYESLCTINLHVCKIRFIWIVSKMLSMTIQSAQRYIGYRDVYIHHWGFLIGSVHNTAIQNQVYTCLNMHTYFVVDHRRCGCDVYLLRVRMYSSASLDSRFNRSFYMFGIEHFTTGTAFTFMDSQWHII